MRYKRLIIASTAIVFVLVCILAAIWLVRVRESEVVVHADSGNKTEVYEFVEKKVSEMSSGRLLPFVDTDAIRSEIEKNPYVTVNSVRKVFPDKVYVEATERRECFASLYDGKYYVTDNEFFLLDIRESIGLSSSEGKIIPISVNNTDLDFSSYKVGERVNYGKSELFGYMVRIYNGIEDRLNTVRSITVNGGSGGENRERVYVLTETGAYLEFRFSDPRIASDEDSLVSARSALCAKAGEVDAFYRELTEKQKSKGFVLAYLLQDYSVKIVYAEDEP